MMSSATLLTSLMCVLITAKGSSTECTRTSFKGYKVLHVQVNTWSQLESIQSFIARASDEYDVWRWPDELGDSLHLALRPSQSNEWDTFCRSRALHCTYVVKDLQSLIDLEQRSTRENKLQGAQRHRRETSSEVLHRLSGIYPTWSEIESWLHDLNTKEELVRVIDIGTTHEGRPLYVVQIKAEDTPDDAAEIFLDSGIHAREWIAPSSAIYAIGQLVDGYYQRTKIRPLVEGLVWYILPVVNPDGYVHSHEKYRLWRKNRAPPPVGVRDSYYGNTTCIGVDLNRNWAFHWGEGGVSTNSCKIIYGGHEAMSELETKALSKFILSRENLHAYLNIHSYGQLFLTRYAYANVTPSDHTELLSLSNHVAETITAVHNITYKSGTAPTTLYSYSGGVADWVKGIANVKFSFSTELRDRGTFGFILPANYVIPVGEELFAGLVAMGEHVLARAINISQTVNEMDMDEQSTTSNSDFIHTSENDIETSLSNNRTHTTRKAYTSPNYNNACTVGISDNLMLIGSFVMTSFLFINKFTNQFC